MARRGVAIRALEWEGAALRALDQTLLPGAERWLELDGAADTAEAIRRLAASAAGIPFVVAGPTSSIDAVPA
jgi:methylthioribose-1-phosphate isomerase